MFQIVNINRKKHIISVIVTDIIIPDLIQNSKFAELSLSLYNNDELKQLCIFFGIKKIIIVEILCI